MHTFALSYAFQTDRLTSGNFNFKLTQCGFSRWRSIRMKIFLEDSFSNKVMKLTVVVRHYKPYRVLYSFNSFYTLRLTIMHVEYLI